MSGVGNPLSGLIDGLLQGHSLALQMRKQQMEEQAFQTNQALHNQQMSMQDIMNRQMLGDTARPVSAAGTVTNPAGPSVPSDTPGTQPIQAPAYERKADASRTVKYGGQQFELKTPEEQEQGKLNREIQTQSALEQAKGEQAQRVRASVLQMRGVPVPDDIAAALRMPQGSQVLPEEIPGLAEHMQTIRKGDFQKVGPGETLYDTGGAAAPGTPGGAAPKAVASGGPPNPTGDFERVFLPAFAAKQGKTVAGLGPDLTMQAVQEYAKKSKDPETLELAHSMTRLNLELAQQRLQDMRAKGAGAQAVEYKPGDREYRIAQDLAYGKLTLPQFRTIFSTRGEAGQNKKLDIYDLATKLNPNFNPAQFEMGYHFALNPKTQNQLASMDNVDAGIGDLLKFSDAASRTGITALNKVILPGGLAIGGKHYSDFHTAQTAFADELSGALGFGSASDMSKQMGLDMTNPNLSPENFRSAVENVIQPFVARKRASLLKEMGVYGQPGNSPAAGPAVPQPGGGRGAPAGKITVQAGDGSVHPFDNEQQAAQFEQMVKQQGGSSQRVK